MREMLQAEDDIEITERYDREDDIYYVTMNTGEPSHVLEHDDALLVELGIFTGLPTGFRILNYSKNKDNIDRFKHAFKELCKALGLRKIKKTLEARHRRIDKFFDSVGA
jgi:hypothetical protein